MGGDLMNAFMYRSVLAGGIRWLLLTLSLVVLWGCHTPPKGSKFNIEVSPGQDIKLASVEVDLIGATEREKSYFETYPIDKYWEPGDPGRRDAEKYTIRLDDGKSKTLAVPDPIWDRWLSHGDIYLVVIAHLPGDFKGMARDPRREILSLQAKKWKTTQSQLHIEIQERFIKVLTLEKLP
jgi:hypothetical protein